MDNLKMHTLNLADENFRKLSEMFPNAVTETKDEDGDVVRAIDADVLRQEISATVVEGPQERYQFTWPDKKKSVIIANQPIAKTLRLDRKKSVGRDGTPGSIDTENIYIEGDNLDALKLLQETYLGKVKMIYIDPPYNTGSDAFVYDDDRAIGGEEFAERSGQRDDSGNLMFDMRPNNETNGRFHTDWLNMMYPRLRLAKDLLSEDGFIAISIGEEELYNLFDICNEIFGESNFRNIIETRRYDKNLNLQFINEGLSTLNVGLEYILVYSRMCTSKMMPVYREASDERSNLGYWKGFWNNADRPTMRYELFGYTPNEGQWKWQKSVSEEAVKNYQEYEKNYSKTMSLEEYWKITGEKKRFLRRNPNGSGKNMGIEHWVAPTEGILRNSNWSDMLASKPTGVGIMFDSPKNIDVIQELVKLFNVTENDIVLDFFSGSATTAHAVLQLNAEDDKRRKYIMVQIPELCDKKSEAYKSGYKNICEIGEERIIRAGKQIKENAPLTTNNLDVGFRLFYVDDSNLKDVYYRPIDYIQGQMELFADNIKPDRTKEDLLYQVMLDLGILLSSKIEEIEIAGKHVFSVSNGYLMACFDTDVTDNVVTEIAKRQPFYVVFRDSGIASDSVMANFEQIFETFSPNTQRKVL